MKKSVLVVAAHPDDEVLGCGGTIAKLTTQGATVNVVSLSDGVTSRDSNIESAVERVKSRQQAALKSSEILQVNSFSFLGYPDNRLDTIALLDLVKEIENQISSYQADMVITHNATDLNIDHQKTHQATITACRPQPGCSVKRLLFFEVPSSTEWQIPGYDNGFQPNWYEDVSEYLDRKIDAIGCYEDELCDWPHPRSVEGIKYLARWRGSTVGVSAAEAFMLGRFLSD